MTEQVTAIVRARVRPENAARYREATQKISEECSRFPGYSGTRSVEPKDSNSDWVTIFSFDDYNHYERWISSDRRAQCIGQLDSLVEGQISREQIHGLHYWFEAGSDSGHSWPPSWRMTGVAFIAIFPLSFFLAPFVKAQMPNHPLLGTVAGIAAVTCVMSYVSLPLAVHLFRRWL
jgi:antibiotic biosynthesis monooxygenase (ABM) superfamily enzyme